MNYLEIINKQPNSKWIIRVFYFNEFAESYNLTLIIGFVELIIDVRKIGGERDFTIINSSSRFYS